MVFFQYIIEILHFSLIINEWIYLKFKYLITSDVIPISTLFSFSNLTQVDFRIIVLFSFLTIFVLLHCFQSIVYVVANVESGLEFSHSTLASNLGLMLSQVKNS